MANDVDAPSADVVKVVRELGGYLPPDIIARATGRPVSEIRLILKGGSRLTPEDKEIADKVRVLADEAIRFGHRMMRFGPMDVRLRVMSTVLGHAAKLIGQESQGGADEMRVAFQSLMSDMRSAPATKTIVTETDIIDVEVGASSEATDDQE